MKTFTFIMFSRQMFETFALVGKGRTQAEAMKKSVHAWLMDFYGYEKMDPLSAEAQAQILSEEEIYVAAVIEGDVKLLKNRSKVPDLR